MYYWFLFDTLNFTRHSYRIMNTKYYWKCVLKREVNHKFCPSRKWKMRPASLTINKITAIAMAFTYTWHRQYCHSHALVLKYYLKQCILWILNIHQYRYRNLCIGVLDASLNLHVPIICRCCSFLSYRSWLWWLVSNGTAVTFNVELPFMLL